MAKLLGKRRIDHVSTRSSKRATAAVAFAAGVAVAAVVRRVEVHGDSMLPTLASGDRLLALRWPSARPGTVVVVRDPRAPQRLLVKRVAATSPGAITVVGDNPEWSTDSRAFGAVPAVWGRALYRYHPAHRAGPVG